MITRLTLRLFMVTGSELTAYWKYECEQEGECEAVRLTQVVLWFEWSMGRLLLRSSIQHLTHTASRVQWNRGENVVFSWYTSNWYEPWRYGQHLSFRQTRKGDSFRASAWGGLLGEQSTLGTTSAIIGARASQSGRLTWSLETIFCP